MRRTKIGLAGYAAIQADNIAAVIDKDNKCLGKAILVCDSKFNLCVRTGVLGVGENIRYELTYNFEAEDHQRECVETVHHTMSDIFEAFVDISNVKVTDIEYSLQQLTAVDTRNVYLPAFQKKYEALSEREREAFINICMGNEDSLSLDEMYIRQYEDIKFAKVYASFFLVVKYALIQNLISNFVFPGMREWECKNNCLTLWGDIPKSEIDDLFGLLSNLRYSDVPLASLLNNIVLEMEEGEPNDYIYSGYPINTPNHLAMIVECDYIIFCDSVEHYECLDEGARERLKHYLSMLPDTKVDYFLLKDYKVGIDPLLVDQLLESTDNIVMRSFLGDSDLKWVAPKQSNKKGTYFKDVADTVIIDTEVDTAEDLIFACSTRVEDHKKDYVKIGPDVILQEVNKVGLNGFQDPPIEKFEEDTVHVSTNTILRRNDQQIDTELGYPLSELDFGDVHYVVYEVEGEFSITSVPSNHIQEVVERLQHIAALTESYVASPTYYNYYVPEVDRLLKKVKQSYLAGLKERLADVDEWDLPDAIRSEFMSILLAGTNQELFSTICSVTCGKDLRIEQVPEDIEEAKEIYEYMATSYRAVVTSAIYREYQRSVTQFWVGTSKYPLCTESLFSIENIEKILNQAL